MNQFEALGLSPNLLQAIETLGYDAPTPIQSGAIPSVLAGRDIMGLAQTGTGKTAAFGLPLVQRLVEDRGRPEPRGARALILAPTRELANQIGDNMRAFVKRTHLRIVTVVGGASINTQIRNLERGTDFLIATPGRLLDLVERRALRIDTVRFLVLDEADQMLGLGFIHALRKIASMVSEPRQTLLFSATVPKAIEQLSRAFLTDPVRVETAPAGRTVDKVTQFVHFVPQAQKAALLKDLLLRDPAHLSLVFARTKHGTEKLTKTLVAAGIDAVSIHGNKSQNQRERAIREFRDGAVRVLVATDVAARGIDIPGVSHVYNHDLPEVPESYVHRIGRTARAGASGEAVTLCAPDEAHLLRAIEKLTGIAARRLNEAPVREPRRSAPADTGERRAEAPAGRQAGPRGEGRHEQAGQSRRGNAASAKGAGRPQREAAPAIEGDFTGRRDNRHGHRPAAARNGGPVQFGTNGEARPARARSDAGRPEGSRPDAKRAGEKRGGPNRHAAKHKDGARAEENRSGAHRSERPADAGQARRPQRQNRRPGRVSA